MDSAPVSATHLKAGGEYLISLRRLGLNPLFLGWGCEIASGEWVLGLVTSIVEAGGPLALNKLLFEAYNANATPKEISPFIVRVYSPEIAPEMFYTIASKPLKGTTEAGVSFDITNAQTEFLGVQYEMVNAYFIPQVVHRPKYHDTLAAWQKFKKNVGKLAA